MSSITNLLICLQQADSFFPSGAMAFSWGLESLVRDNVVTDINSFQDFIEAQILYRWATFDRGVVSIAFKSYSSIDELVSINSFVEAMASPTLLQEGSRRLGRALVDVYAKLGLESAKQIQQYLARSSSFIYLPVAQGCLWHALGMSEIECHITSAHTTYTSAVSAAIRLGVIGHLDAQRCLNQMRSLLEKVLLAPAPNLNDLSCSTFMVDIASLHDYEQGYRFFAN